MTFINQDTKIVYLIL